MLNLSRRIMITFCFHICVSLWKFPMTGMWWRRQMLERCRQHTACCQRQPLSLAAYPRLCPTSPRLLVCILTSLWCPRHDFNNICIVVFMVWFGLSFFCASVVLVIFVTMAECSLLMLMIRSVIFFNFNFQCSHFQGELRLASLPLDPPPPFIPEERTYGNKKHLKNVGPIRHWEPPHATLTFTRCRYCRVARRLHIDVYNDDDDDDNNNTWQGTALAPWNGPN